MRKNEIETMIKSYLIAASFLAVTVVPANAASLMPSKCFINIFGIEQCWSSDPVGSNDGPSGSTPSEPASPAASSPPAGPPSSPPAGPPAGGKHDCDDHHDRGDKDHRGDHEGKGGHGR
jgi:hypothetical protein